MSGYSRSTSKGPRNARHNKDNEYRDKLEHVNHDKTKDNDYFIDLPIKQVYHDLFDSSIEEYNKDKKPSRQIKDYYKHIYHSKKHKTYHEMVIQVGDMDHHPDEATCKAIYHDYVKQFQERYPQMKVIGAYIHVDEETPHMHFDYIPWATYEGKKQHVQVSNDRSIKQMGFGNWKEWFADQQQMLVDVMKDHGIEYVDMHNTNRKEDIYVYKEKAKQATKAIQELAPVLAPDFVEPVPEEPVTKKGFTGKETLTIEEHNRIVNEYVDSLRSYVDSLENDYNSLSKKATLLEAQNEALEGEVRCLNDNIRQLKKKPYRLENAKLERENETIKATYVTKFEHDIVKQANNDLAESNDNLLDKNKTLVSKYNNLVDKYNNLANSSVSISKYNKLKKSMYTKEQVNSIKQQYDQKVKSLEDDLTGAESKAEATNWFLKIFGLDEIYKTWKEQVFDKLQIYKWDSFDFKNKLYRAPFNWNIKNTIAKVYSQFMDRDNERTHKHDGMSL